VLRADAVVPCGGASPVVVVSEGYEASRLILRVSLAPSSAGFGVEAETRDPLVPEGTLPKDHGTRLQFVRR
jgi:hypothetical protein